MLIRESLSEFQAFCLVGHCSRHVYSTRMSTSILTPYSIKPPAFQLHERSCFNSLLFVVYSIVGTRTTRYIIIAIDEETSTSGLLAEHSIFDVISETEITELGVTASSATKLDANVPTRSHAVPPQLQSSLYSIVTNDRDKSV